jgi:DNA-binding YbaB/EbfC family protein
MPGGGGGGQGLNQMMKQMQKMQADMAAAQDALAAATVEGSAGGGMVKVVVTGSGEVQSVHIAPEVVDPDDVEMLEDLVLAAVGDGCGVLRRCRARASVASPADSTSAAWATSVVCSADA